MITQRFVGCVAEKFTITFTYYVNKSNDVDL